MQRSPEFEEGKAAWRNWARTLQPCAVVDNEAIVNAVRCFLLERLDPVKRILTFRPMPGEIDLDPLLAEFPCAVTRTWPHGRLTVHSAEADMEHHRWGYLQPVADAMEIPLGEVGVVLVPGLLFDRDGGRLGHGAGYYDRLLPRLVAGTTLIGIAGEAHIVDRVPTDEHDVQMTHLATESGVVVARAK
jgi:5-formyltetrahydrofolate cyclo-ligase